MRSKTIYKYSCSLEFLSDEIAFDMPRHHTVLHVANQYETLCIWALVDPNFEAVTARFRIAGTGHVIDDWDEWEYRGTALFQGGTLVFHVFEHYMNSYPRGHKNG